MFFLEKIGGYRYEFKKLEDNVDFINFADFIGDWFC